MTTRNTEFAIFDEQLFADRAYWLAKLSPELRAVALWRDHDRTDAAADYAQFRFPFESEICRQLSKLTNNSPFLIYTAFVTALSICLHKYSGQSNITRSEERRVGKEWRYWCWSYSSSEDACVPLPAST